MSDDQHQRLDGLARSLARGRTRRGALLGGAGGALATLAGIRRSNAQDNDLGDATKPATSTDMPSEAQTGLGDDGFCRMRFTATVRTGPTIQGNQAPVVSGVLTFRLGDDAEFVAGESELETDAGDVFPVIGQTRGRAVSMRIDLDSGTIVALGTAQRSARSCAGNIIGVTTGPLAGDLGDWRAAASG